MSWWDSIDTVTSFHNFIKISAIALVLLTAIVAFLVFKTGNRKEFLERIAARENDEAMQQQIDEANTKTLKAEKDAAEAMTKVAKADSTLQAEMEKEREAEEFRRKPPEFNADLKVTKEGQYFVEVISMNNVPFKYNFLIRTKDKKQISGVPFTFAEFHPLSLGKNASTKARFDKKKVVDNYLELWFRFESLYASEFLNMPGHKGEIIKKYRIAGNGVLIPLQ